MYVHGPQVLVVPRATRVTDACTHWHVTAVWLWCESGCCQNTVMNRTPLRAPPAISFWTCLSDSNARFGCITRVGNMLINLLINAFSSRNFIVDYCALFINFCLISTFCYFVVGNRKNYFRIRNAKFKQKYMRYNKYKI